MSDGGPRTGREGSADDGGTVHLLRQWCGGDREALVRLVEQNADWIRQRIRRRRGDALAHVETMDQFQELMLDVLRYAPRFVVENRGQFRALLGRMIENDLTDRARTEARRRDLRQASVADSRLSLVPGLEADQTRVSEAAARNEEMAWARLGLEFLDDDARRLVERRIFGGRTFHELEQEFDGVAANTLRMRFNRALVQLTGIVERLKRGEVEDLAGGGGG